MGESTEFSGSGSFGELLIHSYNRDIVFSTQADATFTDVDTSIMVLEKGNGNVGIGNASPDFKLDISNTTFGDQLRLHRSSVASGGFFNFIC